MTRKPVATCLHLIVLVFVLGSIPAEAVDVVLTLDRSLSMKGNDPNRDSIKGVELFSELLSADDRLALTTFAQDSESLLPLTRLSNSGTQERIASLVGRIQMSGIRTNFDAALRTAYSLFSEQTADPATERILVLFSDGQLNLGSEEANQTARAAVMDDLIPKFQAAGIRILGVAFSPEADLDFLRHLADATGGRTFRANTPADIYDAFVQLFEQTDHPLSAPVIDGKVTVDANVQELELLVKRDANDGPMQITNPSGLTISAGDRRPELDWKSTPNFDHITIKQPETGAWTVTADNADKKAYLESELDLQVTLPALASLDETVNIAARLTFQGAPINPNQLQGTQFTATVIDSSGAIQQLVDLPPSSIEQDHRGFLHFTAPGAFQVQISAQGQGFMRHKTYFLTVVGSQPPGLPMDPAAVTNRLTDKTTAADSPDLKADPKATQRSAVFVIVLGNLVLLVLVGVTVGARCWRRRGRAEPEDVDLDE